MLRLIITLLVGFATIPLALADTTEPSYKQVNQSAPFDHITLSTLDGSEVTLKSAATGKPRYIKFWATWCQPCLAQMPHFEKAQQHFGDALDIIAVNIDINDTLEDIQQVKKRFSLTMPIVVDTTGDLAQYFDLKGTPLHILVNRQGEVVYSGHEADEALDAQLAQLALPANKSAQKTESNSAKESQNQKLEISSKGLQALFFSATWCDWYLEKSRPAISRNCVNANNLLNTLAATFEQFNWQGIYNRLWTGEKDLEEYKNKYQITVPLAIDQSNAAMLQYKIKDYPTLVLLRDGKEVGRIHQFDNEQLVNKLINKVL